jgi:hypothetical protein
MTTMSANNKTLITAFNRLFADVAIPILSSSLDNFSLLLLLSSLFLFIKYLNSIEFLIVVPFNYEN